MHFDGRSLGLCCVTLVMLLPSKSLAQQSPESPPSKAVLRSMLAADFVRTVRKTKGASAELQKSFEENAAERLRSEDSVANEDYQSLIELLRISGGALTDDERVTLEQQLRQRDRDIGILQLEELKARRELVLVATWRNLDSNGRVAAAEVAEWITAQPASSLEELGFEDLKWLLKRVVMPRRGIRCFSAKWTGTVTAPRAGDYVFSVSPHNINLEEPRYNYEQSSMVTVAGRQVVNATPEEWEYQGEPVHLTAGQPVELRVDFQYQCDVDAITTWWDAPVQIERSPYATLRWEGPGMNESVVPASALSPPTGAGNGLLAKYRLLNRRAGNVETVVTLVEPQIDHAWIGGDNFISEHHSAQSMVLDLLFTKAMKKSYWDEIAHSLESLPEGPATVSHLLVQDLCLPAYFSPEQRTIFLRELAGRPEILRRISNEKMYRIYTRYRFGTEDAAFDTLAAWMIVHKDKSPTIVGDPMSFFLYNRHNFRMLTLMMPGKSPEKFQRIRDELLELEDGTCCLPAAYTLAYAHLLEGNINDWIEELDASLAEESLRGDRRVNWLIARAMAEEIRRSSTDGRIHGGERLLLGREWLDEAMLVADLEVNRLRVLREIISCQLAMSLEEKVLQRLEDEEGTFDSSDSNKSFIVWRKAIKEQMENQLKAKESDRQATEMAVLADLKIRQQRAIDRGDTTSSERYGTAMTDYETSAEKSTE